MISFVSHDGPNADYHDPCPGRPAHVLCGRSATLDPGVHCARRTRGAAAESVRFVSQCLRRNGQGAPAPERVRELGQCARPRRSRYKAHAGGRGNDSTGGLGRLKMADRVILTIGTKKGVFVADGAKPRRSFALRGPFGPGAPVYSTLIDTRGTPRLYASSCNPFFGMKVLRSTDMGKSFGETKSAPAFPKDDGRALANIWSLETS